MTTQTWLIPLTVIAIYAAAIWGALRWIKQMYGDKE